MEKRLLQSFDINKKSLERVYKIQKADKYNGIDFKLAVSEYYGRCSILASILKHEFDIDKSSEMDKLRKKNNEMYK